MIDNQIQVKSHIMDDEGVILIIKNIAGVTLDIKAKLNLYDKHKNLIVDFDETAMAVAKDYEFLMFFPYASEFDAVDYSFTIDNSNFDPIELSFEEITKDNGEVFLKGFFVFDLILLEEINISVHISFGNALQDIGIDLDPRGYKLFVVIDHGIHGHNLWLTAPNHKTSDSATGTKQ